MRSFEMRLMEYLDFLPPSCHNELSRGDEPRLEIVGVAGGQVR
jgi:hypothetical protein